MELCREIWQQLIAFKKKNYNMRNQFPRVQIYELEEQNFYAELLFFCEKELFNVGQ